MEIIPRARWGARYSAGFGPSPLPARELWLHHSVTIAPDLVWVDVDGDGVEDDEERAMRTLEDIGQQRFSGGVSYTFAVMPSGRIYEGHGVGRQGAHTGGRNDIARAIVLVGDYSTREPTEAQQNAVAWLVEHGRQQGWWTVTGLSGGHRQAPNQIATACPGEAALRRIPAINKRVVDYREGRINTEEDDIMAGLSKQDLEDAVARGVHRGVKSALTEDLYKNLDPAANGGQGLNIVDTLAQMRERELNDVIPVLDDIAATLKNPPHSL